MAIDSMGQIGHIWNYAGRFAAGYASEELPLLHRIPRPLAPTAVLLAAYTGHLLVALDAPREGTLYAASVLTGFCFDSARSGRCSTPSSPSCSGSVGATPRRHHTYDVRVADRLYHAERSLELTRRASTSSDSDGHS
ncbi:hypothetical protein EJB05_25977, partial [Eragrostis curvula]